ncbi:MAG: BrnT family toxin [Gemmatimonadales bacterium]|nr:BrnT family toxin [Gemmatimonadales bacterium]
MAELRFEWDPKKASANLAKHRVSFEEARTIFSDEGGLLLDDPEPVDGEDRFVLLGLSARLRILIVAHCYRGQDKVIRLISARKADRLERQLYVARNS